MVDLKKVPTKDERKLVACRVPIKYIKQLEKRKIGFTDFVLQAFKETFD